MSKVLIFKSMDVLPTEKIEASIAPFLKKGWQVVSANTSLATFGEMDATDAKGLRYRVARHIYYVTTVVVDLPRDPASWRV